jgi:YggT family protein
MFHEASWRLTEPLLGRIRSFLPSFGGLDISPIIALLAIYFLRSLLREYWPLVL